MIQRIQRLLILVCLISFAFQIQGQVIDTIYGCDNIPPPELAGNGCMVSSYNIQYGSSYSYTPSVDAGWCRGVENDQYIAFRTNSAGEVSFSLDAFNCTAGNNPEVGIYDLHNQLVGLCYAQQQQVYQTSNLTPNLVYYIRIDGNAGEECEFNIQFITGISVTSAQPTVYLGRDTFCTATCLEAPTGETVTCTSGLYSFEASNDTTYYGELFIDNSAGLDFSPYSITCDLSTGVWIAFLEWTGSLPPYNLNGQLLNNLFGQIGPFAMEDTVTVTLSGSSFCTDPISIELSSFCTSSVTTIQSLGFEMKQLSTSLLEVTAPSFGWKLSLVDVLGREVYTTPLQLDANQIAVGDLLPGSYFLVVQNGSKMASEKWVKR